MQRDVIGSQILSLDKQNKIQNTKYKKEKALRGIFLFVMGFQFFSGYASEVWKVFLRREWREISHNVWVAQLVVKRASVKCEVGGSIPSPDAISFIP